LALFITSCSNDDKIAGNIIRDNKENISATIRNSSTNITAYIIETNTTSSASSTTTTSTLKLQDNIVNISKVIDGDTIKLTNGQVVRLICIDTPETNEPYYQEAKNRLEKLIENKNVRLEKDVSETDRYGRLLRYVYLDNKFINLIMVEEGYAKAYRYEPDVKSCDELEAAEGKARYSNLGIWSKTLTTTAVNYNQTQYTCSSNAYDCGSFKTNVEAQEVFDVCGGVNNDVHKLDADKDGIACETLT